MNLTDYSRYDAFGLAELVRRGETTARELAGLAIDAVAKVNPAINAIIETFDDVAEDPLRDGMNARGPFAGVPIFIKDLASRAAGRCQSGGMEAWADTVAVEDDPLISNMRVAGLNVLGRSTCSEQGITFLTWTRRFGVTRNPWDLDYTCGGSSGGSGALVAAGITPIAGANDGGGSTRCPAAWNGLVGLKPSRGLLPMPKGLSEAIMPNGVEGILTRTVRDHALAYDFLARRPLGSTFMPMPESPETYLAQVYAAPAPRFRIGVSTGSWGGHAPHPELVAATEAIATLLESLGHDIVPVDDSQICDFEALLDSFFTWNWLPRRSWGIEMLARARGVALNEETLSRIGLKHVEAARRFSPEETYQAQLQNDHVTRQWGAFFGGVDLLLAPAVGILCPRAEAEPYSTFSTLTLDEWVWNLLRSVPYTVAGNATGLPAIALPAGLDSNALPMGIQIYAPWACEPRLFNIAAQIEQARPDLFNRRPPVHVDAPADDGGHDDRNAA